MKIKLVHLYYDLMNLYGESGNVKAIKEFFKKQDINIEIYFLTTKDNINFNDYDIFYMGMGNSINQLIILEDLLNRKKDIKNAIDNGKYFFFTGNSFELLGEYLIDSEGNKIKCLNIFNYYTKINSLDNSTLFRIVGEVVASASLIDEPILGFQNRSGIIYNNDFPLFKILSGTGDKPKDINEGFNYKNFYGTHLLGPLFIRNPYLTNYFIKKIINEKNKNYKIKLVNDTIEFKAYNIQKEEMLNKV